MLFLSHYTYPPERREAVQARFKETGGLPPAGVKMIGRWSHAGRGEGFCVAETDDLQALAKWAQQWSDLMSIETFPVLDDEGVMKMLSSAG